MVFTIRSIPPFSFIPFKFHGFSSACRLCSSIPSLIGFCTHTAGHLFFSHSLIRENTLWPVITNTIIKLSRGSSHDLHKHKELVKLLQFIEVSSYSSVLHHITTTYEIMVERWEVTRWK